MIYLVRHGLDDETYIGGYSDVGLTEVGKKQIDSSGLWLKDNAQSIRKIYTSDVKRAVESAEIINRYFNKEIELIKGLRELDKGLLNGMDKNLAKVLYPDYISVTDINKRYPNGESMIDLYNRIKLFLDEIHNYEDCLLVTHRGVINMIYTLLYNDSLTMNKEKYDVTHSSIHAIDLDTKKIKRLK